MLHVKVRSYFNTNQAAELKFQRNFSAELLKDLKLKLSVMLKIAHIEEKQRFLHGFFFHGNKIRNNK